MHTKSHNHSDPFLSIPVSKNLYTVQVNPRLTYITQPAVAQQQLFLAFPGCSVMSDRVQTLKSLEH